MKLKQAIAIARGSHYHDYFGKIPAPRREGQKFLNSLVLTGAVLNGAAIVDGEAVELDGPLIEGQLTRVYPGTSAKGWLAGYPYEIKFLDLYDDLAMGQEFPECRLDLSVFRQEEKKEYSRFQKVANRLKRLSDYTERYYDTFSHDSAYGSVDEFVSYDGEEDFKVVALGKRNPLVTAGTFASSKTFLETNPMIKGRILAGGIEHVLEEELTEGITWMGPDTQIKGRIQNMPYYIKLIAPWSQYSVNFSRCVKQYGQISLCTPGIDEADAQRNLRKADFNLHMI
jgi:hypothetical protein